MHALCVHVSFQFDSLIYVQGCTLYTYICKWQRGSIISDYTRVSMLRASSWFIVNKMLSFQSWWHKTFASLSYPIEIRVRDMCVVYLLRLAQTQKFTRTLTSLSLHVTISFFESNKKKHIKKIRDYFNVIHLVYYILSFFSLHIFSIYKYICKCIRAIEYLFLQNTWQANYSTTVPKITLFRPLIRFLLRNTRPCFEHI